MTSYGSIKGPCGHVGEFDAFTRQMPKDAFCCPVCGRSWRLERGKPEVYASGFVMPGKITIKEV